MSRSNQKYFKVFLENPGMVVHVKNLDESNSIAYFEAFKRESKKLQSKGGGSVSRYINVIITNLLKYPDEFYKVVDDLPSISIQSTILWEVYRDLTEIYPQYSLGHVLGTDMSPQSSFGGFMDLLDPSEDVQEELRNLFSSSGSDKSRVPAKGKSRNS